KQILRCAAAPPREKFFSDLLIVAVSSARSTLPTAFGASDAQVVVIQRRIEHEEKLALRLVPPHRVRRKHHDVPTTNRHINNRRTVRKLIAAREHAADEQVLFIRRKTQNDARPQLRRHEERALTQIGVWIWPVVWICRPRLRHRLDHIRIVNTATSGSTRAGATTATALTTAATTTRTATGLHLKQRRLAKIDR